MIAVDLTEAGAPARVREVVEREHGELHLLVNNAGASWRGGFAETGWANVERHMKLNFEAPVRLTEALLPLLRATAAQRAASLPPVSIVNVASTAGRVSRPNSGAYSASKFALAGWTDALHAEEREHGVHVGLVLPGSSRPRAFPATELLAKPLTRWLVSEPGGGGRGDHGRRARRPGRALRAAVLLAGGGAADPGAGAGPPRHRRGGAFTATSRSTGRGTYTTVVI